MILLSGFFSLFILAEQGVFPKTILNSYLKDRISICNLPVSYQFWQSFGGMQVILLSGFLSLFILAEQGLFSKTILNSYLKDHASDTAIWVFLSFHTCQARSLS